MLTEKITAPVLDAFKAGLITRQEALEELRSRGADVGAWMKVGEGEGEPEMVPAGMTERLPTEAEEGPDQHQLTNPDAPEAIE